VHIDPALIKLTNDLLLIRRLPDEVETVSPGGIIIPAFGDDPDKNKDTPLRGVVLAAGLGRRPKLSHAGANVVKALQACVNALGGAGAPHWHHPLITTAQAALREQAVAPDRVLMQVEVGDTVIFSKWGFQEFRIGGEDLIVTQEASILGMIDQ